VLSAALVEFAKTASPEQLREGAKKLFGEVILAAPAIDAQTFVKKWAADVAKVCDKVNIFASDDDMALKVQSLAEDGDFSFPLGLLSEDKAAFPDGTFNFDLSDLTEGTFSLDHSVYAAVKPALDHMGMILKDQPVREEQIPLVNKAGYPYLVMSKRFDFFTPVPPARTVWKFLKI
jgi:esterase/lipase superfamily enzyme